MADGVIAAATFLFVEDLVDVDVMAITSQFEERAPIFPYWRYERFDINSMNEDECRSKFRFEKEDIPRLMKAFRLPPKFVCSNETTASAVEGLCMMLKRFAYPCRYSDLIPRFGRSKSKSCDI